MTVPVVRAAVARYFIRSIEADAAADGTAETAALLERLLSYEGGAAITEDTHRRPRCRSGVADGFSTAWRSSTRTAP
jgi:hypothetical protein